MKKVVISLAFVVGILLVCMGSTLAANASATLITDKEEVNVGDTITVKLNLTCNNSMSYIGTKINYDAEYLTLQDKTIESNWENYNTFPDIGALVKTADKEYKSVDICTMVFKVNKVGTTKITTENIEVTDTSNVDYPIQAVEKQIVIAEKQEESKEEAKEEAKEETKITTEKQQDANTTKSVIPKTGISTKVIAILIVAVASTIVVFIKYNKYRNI